LVPLPCNIERTAVNT